MRKFNFQLHRFVVIESALWKYHFLHPASHGESETMLNGEHFSKEVDFSRSNPEVTVHPDAVALWKCESYFLKSSWFYQKFRGFKTVSQMRLYRSSGTSNQNSWHCLTFGRSGLGAPKMNSICASLKLGDRLCFLAILSPFCKAYSWPTGLQRGIWKYAPSALHLNSFLCAGMNWCLLNIV